MDISQEAAELYEAIAMNVVKLAELGYVRPQKRVGTAAPFDAIHMLVEIHLDNGRINLTSDNFEGFITSVSTSQMFDVQKFPITEAKGKVN